MQNLMPRRESDFVFTRDKSSDYQFKVARGLSSDVQDAIVRLQDNFTSLVDGIGFYSFRVGDTWVTATSLRTSHVDAVGRSVYEIRGHVAPVDSIGELWFSFMSLPERARHSKLDSQFCQQQAASWELLPAFIRTCRRCERPVSWAFGVRPLATDTTGIQLDIRFVPTEHKKLSRRWKVVRALFRICKRCLPPFTRHEGQGK